MTEAEWLACVDPEPMLRALGAGEPPVPVADARRARLFMCACCRRVEVVLPTFWNRADLDTAERLADGLVSDREHQESARNVGDSMSAVHRRLINEARGGARAGGAPGRTGAELAALRGLRAALVETRLFYASGEDARTGAVLALSAATSADEFEDEESPSHRAERAAQSALLRDIFGNPFRPVAFSPEWRTSTAVAVAAQMYESREFGAMPILGDALQDAGCDSADVLDHCRGPGPHVYGCWVADLVLGKE
ncbi:Uncharacterized protein OS=Sorangium cellulosum (strain So ce56) GN=sce5710 PE=4 SV=1 [Gemmata massiliana]|uniref:SMI1/KNR4 family protein n=1 Tax=Gemmata massiliana TaxID=1210884 RepID=A0A6P2CXI7_9BACT|nr:hypothetical protein [Gemmata massiliana]VTR93297.1 Uncharacterized protein OS=Sorangium cellulosum (strain So ce56) GN=sce5710 PE=4 SV=1 [Gemmata massiliana]